MLGATGTTGYAPYSDRCRARRAGASPCPACETVRTLPCPPRRGTGPSRYNHLGGHWHEERDDASGILGGGGRAAAGGCAGGAAAGQLACDVTTNNTFSGRVTRDAEALTVRGTDEKERSVTAGPGLVVVRDGAPSNFADVREGDQVNVTVPAGAADCTATRIEATSTTVAAARDEDEDRPWGLLGLLGLLGLGGLLRRPKPTERVITRTVAEPREPLADAPRERTVAVDGGPSTLGAGERVVLRPGEAPHRER